MQKHRRCGASALLACFLLTTFAPTNVARAEPSQADKVTARDLLREGKELREKGDHDGAKKKFKGAYALVPTPITGLALAREQVALGEVVEARELLGDIERMPVKSTETEDGKKARVDAAALYSEITPKIPVIAIVIKAPAGATIELTVDGKAVPAVAAEAGLRVNPGSHVAVAKVDGVEQSKPFTAKESEHGKVELIFTAPAKPPEPPPPPPAVTSPTPVESPKPGPHDQPSTSGSSIKWIGLTTLGVGVVGMGVGGVLGLSAQSSYNDVKRAHCPTGACDPDGLSGISDARGRAGTATIVFVVGAALAAGGAVLWLTAPSSESKTGATAVGFGPGSVTIAGSF